MGCWDMYCSVCGAPFTPFNTTYYPKMVGIDTNWLGEVVVDYKNGQTVDANNYDSYGRFTSTTGQTLDVGLQEADGELTVYHKLCQGKTNPTNDFSEYQEQFFDIEKVIRKRKHKLLDRSRNT